MNDDENYYIGDEDFTFLFHAQKIPREELFYITEIDKYKDKFDPISNHIIFYNITGEGNNRRGFEIGLNSNNRLYFCCESDSINSCFDYKKQIYKENIWLIQKRENSIYLGVWNPNLNQIDKEFYTMHTENIKGGIGFINSGENINLIDKFASNGKTSQVKIKNILYINELLKENIVSNLITGFFQPYSGKNESVYTVTEKTGEEIIENIINKYSYEKVLTGEEVITKKRFSGYIYTNQYATVNFAESYLENPSEGIYYLKEWLQKTPTTKIKSFDKEAVFYNYTYTQPLFETIIKEQPEIYVTVKELYEQREITGTTFFSGISGSLDFSYLKPESLIYLSYFDETDVFEIFKAETGLYVNNDYVIDSIVTGLNINKINLFCDGLKLVNKIDFDIQNNKIIILNESLYDKTNFIYDYYDYEINQKVVYWDGGNNSLLNNLIRDESYYYFNGIKMIENIDFKIENNTFIILKEKYKQSGVLHSYSNKNSTLFYTGVLKESIEYDENLFFYKNGLRQNKKLFLETNHSVDLIENCNIVGLENVFYGYEKIEILSL